jgi:amino acid efflux transporter
MNSLSTTRGAALYVGALLGPSLLLLPGLAASLAGPASILAWVGLLAVSGLLALVFTALGTRMPSGAGVAGYTSAGLGSYAGRIVGWSFLVGVVLGAPVVCLIGGSYLAALVGGGRIPMAAGLLLVVVALSMSGARASGAAQLVLVAVLIALVVAAVVGSAPSARSANWTPFAPHGWTAVGSAGSVLMLSFVGWEAIAPLTARLRDPARQLPRIIAIAFAVTTVIYLALAAATIAVLGPHAGGSVPLADLLAVAIGPAGRIVAVVAAVALTLAATNAYIAGAGALLRELRPTASTGRLQIAILLAGVLLLGAVAGGVVSTAQLVALPTTLFLTVYLGCTVSAARLLTGRVRLAAAVAAVAVVATMSFSGWALVLPVVVAIVIPVEARLTEYSRRGSLQATFHREAGNERAGRFRFPDRAMAGICPPRR